RFSRDWSSDVCSSDLNAPGGGFIAGLAAAGSIALQLLAFDMEHVERVFPFNFVNVVAVGLMLAAGVGFAPVFLGLPFLTSAFERSEERRVGKEASSLL